MIRLLFVLAALLPVTASAQTGTTGTLTRPGAELFYAVLGQGPPLLLLHGGPGMNHAYFQPHVESLAESFTLILVDHRASGWTHTAADADMSMDAHIADYEALREHLGYKKWAVLGHSWGGYVAMHYIQRAPKSVSHLLLVTSMAASGAAAAASQEQQQAIREKKPVTAEDRDRLQALVQRYQQQQDTAAISQFMAINFSYSLADPTKIDQLQLYAGPNYIANQALLGGLAPEMNNYNLNDALASYKGPVLVIHGAHDRSPQAWAEDIVSHCRNGQLIIFENSGHFPFMEEAARFKQVVTEFLAG